MTTSKCASSNNTVVYKQDSIRHSRRSKRLAMFGFGLIILFAGIFSIFVDRPVQDLSASTAMPVLSGRSAVAHLKQKGSLDSLSAAITAARYEPVVKNTEIFADNYANEMRLKFSGNGLLVESTAKDANWQSGLRVRSLGYGLDQGPVGAGELRTKENRVELKRDAQKLTEWYENSPKGLEHGFTVAARPHLSNDEQPLRLVMALDGDLSARADGDGRALTLFNNDGTQTLRYENLKAWDANGSDLNAQMRMKGSEIWLDVADKSAQYPITIDPTLGQIQKLTAADGAADDLFGSGVAISGTTAVVGAGSYQAATARSGAAYVFVRTGLTWTLQQKLTAADAKANDAFGATVAIDTDTVVVGAFGDTVGGNANQGSAYVFTRSGTTWTQQAKLTANDGAASDFFGWSVAIVGDTVAVGANSDDFGAVSNQGSAYIFIRNGATWTLQQKLFAPDGATGDFFGDSIALSGNTVIIGATEKKIGVNTQQGAAYVFVTDGATWAQQQRLTASDGPLFGFFGFSVAISGNTAIVGSLQDIGANFQQGSAYVFVRSGATWTQQQKLTASDGASPDSFGGSVAVVGDKAYIGAYGDANGANLRQGSAYAFTRTGSTWTQQQKLIANDGAAEDSFGASIAATNNDIIIGAMNATVGANQLQGSAYIFSTVVTVSGKVTTPTGSGLKSAVVSIVDPFGVKRSVITNSFGIYTLDTIQPGQMYQINVTSKRFRFVSQNLQIDNDLTNINFVGLE